jgi:hypothetical protein
MSRPVRRLLLTVVGTLLVAGAVLAGLWVNDRTAFRQPAPQPAAVPAAGTPGPAGRPDDPGATEVLEPGPGQPVAMDDQPSPSGGNVDVHVTYASWVAEDGGLEVDGFISGVVEDGGVCRVSATRAGTTLTADGQGLGDASTTSCGAVLLRNPRLTEGEWSVVLSYTSPTSTGKSEPVRAEVSR